MHKMAGLSFTALIFALELGAVDTGVKLFDGLTLTGWRASDGSDAARSWAVENGSITTIPTAAGPVDLVSESFGDREFELSFSVRLSAKANTGVKYFVAASLSPLPAGTPAKGSSAAGMELQLCEDGANDAKQPDTRSGSLYGLFPAIESVPTPAGEWIEVRIVCKDFACEHWLNGKSVASFDLASEGSQAKLRRAAADTTRSYSAGLGAAMMLRKIDRGSSGPGSRVALQHHNTKVWFRDLRLLSVR